MQLLFLVLWVLVPEALVLAATPSILEARAASASPASHAAVSLVSGDRREPRSPELAAFARSAAGALVDRQQAKGHWLTTFTGEARYENPRPERNTFTTALLVDILAPVAKDSGTAAALDRARAFLAAQVEDDGLVRYHGRADSPPDGGVWSCVITPDADDTALVWRIAPAEDPELLGKALAALRQFRAANGLYRTWLAPRARYQCIDPGSDPNPTDIGIQMNVLMLLSQVDRPAALALCGALQRESAHDRVWVYYGSMAPLVPMLRLPDLQRAGCRLEVPSSHSRTSVPGQGIWLELVQLLATVERGEAATVEYARAGDLLRQLAANEFALVKGAPPLLYHNDLSAPTRRFYWSQEVGYALWLRLYLGLERTRRGAA